MAVAIKPAKSKYKPTALESLVVELADAAQQRGRARAEFQEHRAGLHTAVDEAIKMLERWDIKVATRRVELVAELDTAVVALEPWSADWPAGRPRQWVEVADTDTRLAVVVAEVVGELAAHLDEVDAVMLEALAAGLATGPI